MDFHKPGILTDLVEPKNHSFCLSWHCFIISQNTYISG